MKSNQKLLAYVQLLEAKLPTASFTHAHNLEKYALEGQIINITELEKYISTQLQPHLFRWEAPAIYNVYHAVMQKDAATIAHLDHAIIQQIIEPHQMEKARQTGKRLLKLARNLYPWMNFDLLQQAMSQYEAILSLTVLHAWINIQLGMEREQAIECYFYTLLSCCISRVSSLLDLSLQDAHLLTDRLSDEMEQQWLQQVYYTVGAPDASFSSLPHLLSPAVPPVLGN